MTSDCGCRPLNIHWTRTLVERFGPTNSPVGWQETPLQTQRWINSGLPEDLAHHGLRLTITRIPGKDQVLCILERHSP